MPGTSKRQARFMAACSHGAGYASCPPMKVSKEFNAAEAGADRLTGPGGLVQKGGFMAKKLP